MTAPSAEVALSKVEDRSVSLVLQDMNFSRLTTGEEGIDLLRRIRSLRPDLPVVLMTAWGSIALAVKGMQAGAADFVTKPWTNQHLLQTVRTAMGLAAAERRAKDAAPRSREQLDALFDFGDLVGRAPSFLRILEIVGRVGPTDASVLITGESGTGKELIAEAIHRISPRRAGPFVKVNLGGLSGALFESEMFGHVRGPSRTPVPIVKGDSKWRAAAPSSSTRSASWSPPRRSRCCASFRTAPSRLSDRALRARSM
jgi:two-component system NtrC family response regulator